MDADGLDNPQGGCDANVNGVGFGDGITDNERWGMRRFLSYCNPGVVCPPEQSDPQTTLNYYNYLKGIWKDDTRMVYGGNGHINNCTSCEFANFMFPGNSDPCSWGTGGIVPSDLTSWTEQNAGNIPGDRRGIGSMGPFTFFPGDTAEIDIAFVFGRDYVDTINPFWASVDVMKERIDSIRVYFENNIIPCGGSPCSFSFTGISENQREIGNVIIYPNPAKENLTVAFPLQSKDAHYTIYDVMGREIASGKLTSSKNIISLTHLNRGMYVLQIKDEKRGYYRKFVKM